MSAVLRAIPDLMRVAFAGHVAYRAEMTIWILSTTMPLIMLALWSTVAGSGPVAGLEEVDFARYFVATLVVRQLTSAWAVHQLNFEIRTGSLSTKLLKPMHPLWQMGIAMLTAMPFRVLVISPMIGLLLLWRPELAFAPDLPRVGLLAVSLLAGWGLNFGVQVWFGILAFWLDKTDNLFGKYFALWMLLSGYMAPHGVFPEWAQRIVVWSPWRGMHGLPTELASGLITPEAAAPQVAVQLGWLALVALAVAFTWRRGVRRYGAFGA